MTDGGHVPSEGLAEHLHGGADPLGTPGGGPAPGVHPHAVVPPTAVPAPEAVGWQAEHRPAYTFLDQPEQLEDEEDVLLMPGPQAAWGEPLQGQPEAVPVAPAPMPAAPVAPPVAPPVAAVPIGDTVPLRQVEMPAAGVPVAEAQPGVPVEPSWPPLTPPVGGPVAQPAAEPVVQAAPVVPQVEYLVAPPTAPTVQAAPPVPPVPAEQPAAPELTQRRPLHAGPPIPDPSMTTGQVPVRSLADRGPAGHGDPQAYAVRPMTPPAGVPVPGMPVPGAPVPAAPAHAVPVAPATPPMAVEQPIAVPQVVPTPPVETPAVVYAEAPVAEAAPAAVVAAQPAPPQPVAVEPVAVEPIAVPAAPEAVAPPQAEQPLAAAVAVEEAPVEGAQAAIPAQATPRGGRRIAAFLAAPASHNLAREPIAVPHAEPAPEVVVGTGDLVVEQPAAVEAPVERVAEPVVEVVAAVAEPQPIELTVPPQTNELTEPQTTEPQPAEPTEPQLTEVQPVEQPVPAEPEPEPVAVEAAPQAEAAPVEAEQPTLVEPEAPVAEVAEPVEQAEEEPQAEGEAARGYGVTEREAVHQVIRERRDIRNGFRRDPIPHDVLIRVLEAAHTAPSVGYSQPWDFVVIRSAKTRQRMHALAERQRDAYADSLPKGRAKQFKEIKIEAILDTPVNIVVTADRTRGGRHTLGRHTQPQMAPYSAALAVENLWLAARAEGLGVGWVSFFDEAEMIRQLGLPEHLEVVAYLCVGYVDSFPEEPELQQQGWAKKRPLSWVVHEEQYGNRALPGEEPHSVLEETVRRIRPLDAKKLGEAWERQKVMTKPAGSLGMLEIIAAQLSGLSRKCPPPIPEPGCVAIFAGDHGVHAQGVTPWPQEVTAQMVGNFLAGGAVVNSFAAQIGAEVCVVDVGVAAELPEAIQQGRTTGLLPRKVKPGTDDMTQGPAMSREEALKAIEVGIETARDLVTAGNKVLITGDMGIANTTASAALIAVFTGADPAEVTGRGTGIDDETHTHKVEVIRRALALHQPDPNDPIGVLAAVGGLEHAAIAGFLLGAASLRTPVILDGVIAGSAALVAKAIAPEVLAACIAGHRSAEPGHQAALAKLGLRPLIDLDLRLGEGTGAVLALPLVQSAARAMHDVATFDSAGVTEKA